MIPGIILHKDRIRRQGACYLMALQWINMIIHCQILRMHKHQVISKLGLLGQRRHIHFSISLIIIRAHVGDADHCLLHFPRMEIAHCKLQGI